MKITTTTKNFRDGVKLSGKKGDEVHWESTGHLHVRLLDSSGTVPLAKRAVKFNVPGEGSVEKESDDDGTLFHPDVPFQDYDPDIGDGVKVYAAAVANRDEKLDRYVYEVELAFANVQVREEDGTPVGPGKLTLSSVAKTFEGEVDEEGMLEADEPLPSSAYEIAIKTTLGETYKGKVTLDNRRRQLFVATVAKEVA